MILVESDRLLASRRLAVGTAATTIDLPVGIDWARHDIYVTVVVLRPASAADAITPSRALGVLHLPLDRRDRRLALELDAPSEIRPQSRLAVAVRAPDAAGQAVRVALAAVDVGVLSITDFETPDPVAFFFGRRQLAADARDLYGRLIEGQGGDRALLRFGGDGDATAGGPRPDAKVEIVALSAEPVRLDASGSATVELAVPYFNGRLRLMAVAFGPDGVGSGERELTVAAPVVAELSTPRFLAPGDRSELTVDLHNRTDAAVPLRLSLGATGPVVIGAGPTTVEVAAGARTTLRYPLLGADAFGVGEVRVAVVGPEVVALRTRELGVRPAWPGETRRARHRIEPGARVDLEPRLADGLMPETVRAALTLSEHPPLALETALDGLLRYPYGCLEQTVSRARPLLWADAALAGRLGLEPVPADRRQRWVEAAIERVGSLQLGGGGFGLWSERSEAEPWLTPYAVDFLLDARAAGHAVPTAMLDAAVTHLQRRLRAGVDVGRYSESPAHLAFASQAYAAYVLSRIGKAPLGTIRALYDREHARAESLLPLMHIGLALAAQGDRRRGAEALTRAFATSRPPRTYLGDYGSDVRDLAAGVALLAGQSQPLPGGDALAFRLADALANRRWLSTQEQAAVLAAGRALLARAPSGFDARIESAGEARAVAGEGVRREVLAAERLSAGVAVANEGENPLWVAVSAAGYAAERPAPTREGDLLVERVLRSMDGRPLDASAGLAVGEQVLVQLRVRARETIEHALVVDLLPAGLEIAIADLGSGEAASELTVDGRPVGELQASTRHVEYREDRYAAALPLMAGSTADLFYLARAVTPGEYRVPPPGVEDMYRPDIRALGEA